MLTERARAEARAAASQHLDLYMEEIEAYRKLWGQVDREAHLQAWWRATQRMKDSPALRDPKAPK